MDETAIAIHLILFEQRGDCYEPAVRHTTVAYGQHLLQHRSTAADTLLATKH